MKIHVRLRKLPRRADNSTPFYQVTVDGRIHPEIQVMQSADELLKLFRMQNCRVTIQDTPTSHTRRMKVNPGSAVLYVTIKQGHPLCFCTATWTRMGLPLSGYLYIRIYRNA